MLQFSSRAPGFGPRMVLGALRPPVAVSCAALLFLAVSALRLADDNAADATTLLYAIPVALCAISLGMRGGIAAGGLAVGLTASWLLFTHQPVGALGYLSRGVAFLLLGTLLGRFADERRALEEALDRHAELSPDLTAIAGQDGHFKRVNPAWNRVLGYQDSELLGRPFIDFVHPDDREATVAEAGKLTAPGNEGTRFRNRYKAADGTYRLLEWLSTVDPRGELIYANARDVTAQAAAEDALKRYSEILEERVRERTRALDEAQLETLSRLALAAEYRDDDTQQHTQRVGAAAALLARELGLSDDEILLVRQAAPLHDIGKIGVSDTILLKPGRLTPPERETMQQHVEIGIAILANSRSLVLQCASEIVRTHHEWWDGSGYPSGLRGEEIPIVGRIVGLVDVFDALTHVRPYKRALSVDEALDEIEQLAGRQFDPTTLDAFMKLDHRALIDATAVRLTPARVPRLTLLRGEA